MTKEATLEWQDISTAPKDGTRVLVSATLPRAGTPTVLIAKVSKNGGWVTIPGGWNIHPTDWMPLPTPPKPVSAKTRREAARDMKADMYGENGNG